MQGQLSEHPLAELIHEIRIRDLSGVVRLERERVKAAVYAHAGGIVLVSTNLRQARLAEFMRRWNTLDASSWQQAEPLLALPAGATDNGFAELLIRHAILDETAINLLRARQSEEILRSLLAWKDGEWWFDARVRLEEAHRVILDERRCLVQAARAMNEDFVVARFPNPAEAIRPASRISYSSTLSAGIELLPAEAFLLSRVEAAITVNDLLYISALPELQTRKALYALVIGDMLRREHPPLALTPETSERARERLAALAATASKARGADEELAHAGVNETDEERMKALFARGEAGTHYTVLGVSRNAPADRIKSAYYALAKRFHPDVFSRERTTAEDRARIEAAFVVMTSAYETLRSSDTRAKYDLQLLSRTPTAPAPEPAPEQVASSSTNDSARGARARTIPPRMLAEENFQDGLRAEQSQNNVLALRRFGEAAQLAPHEARYRAHFGRALAADPGKRKQAEAELLAAANLAATDATYRLMLAEFYREVGLRRRALGEAERARALAPDDARIRDLLKRLQRGE